MADLMGGLLVIGALAALITFIFTGRDGFRRLFGGLLGRQNDRWAGGLPANLLLIVTAVMFALETGVAAGGAGSGLAAILIIGAAILLAVAPNIAQLVLGVMGLLWAVPKMTDQLGAGVVVPLVLLSLLAAGLAGMLRRG
jgi:hypothetical protein